MCSGCPRSRGSRCRHQAEITHEGYLASPFAARAGQRAGVIREVKDAMTMGTRRVSRRIILAQLVHYSRVGGHGGADVVAKRGWHQQLGLRPHQGRGAHAHAKASPDRECFAHAVRALGSPSTRCFSRAGHTRNSGQTPKGDMNAQRRNSLDSYLRTGEGWLYLCVIRDGHSRRVLGWAMDSVQDSHMVERALSLAHTLGVTCLTGWFSMRIVAFSL